MLTGQTANTNLKKKKKEATCLVMEFLSFQQDPGSISHNYEQLSYSNYKDPVLVKTCLVSSHKLCVRPEPPAPFPFLPGLAKSRPAPGLLSLGLSPNAACTARVSHRGETHIPLSLALSEDVPAVPCPSLLRLLHCCLPRMGLNLAMQGEAVWAL